MLWPFFSSPPLREGFQSDKQQNTEVDGNNWLNRCYLFTFNSREDVDLIEYVLHRSKYLTGGHEKVLFVERGWLIIWKARV